MRKKRQQLPILFVDTLGKIRSRSLPCTEFISGTGFILPNAVQVYKTIFNNFMDLIKKSEDLKKDADLVISKTKINELLSKLGKVTFVGSYAFNLLYRQDIDIFVQSSDCSRKKAVKLTKVFLDSCFFQTVGFADWTEQQPLNNVTGFYWELVHYSDKYQWKFDIWYTDIEDIKTISITKRINEKLKDNPRARQQILRLKEKYFDGVKYRDDMNGIKIYEQVLGNVQNS